MKKHHIAAIVFVAGSLAIVYANSGDPSLWSRFKRSYDIDSCLNRTSCWDYARDGCVGRDVVYSKGIPPTEEQMKRNFCHGEEIDQLMKDTKHLRLWN